MFLSFESKLELVAKVGFDTAVNGPSKAMILTLSHLMPRGVQILKSKYHISACLFDGANLFVHESALPQVDKVDGVRLAAGQLLLCSQGVERALPRAVDALGREVLEPMFFLTFILTVG